LLERRADVLDDGAAVVEERHGDRVEAHPLDARIVCEAAAPEALAGGADAGLLGRVDALQGALPGAGASGAHLDDGDHRALAHHEIQLQSADAELLREDLEARGGEVLRGDRLGPIAQRLLLRLAGQGSGL
jgi:hypothetical protein